MTKSTKDLLETMEKSSSYRDYLKENRDHLEKNFMKVDRVLSALLQERQAKKADVIARAGIEVHYGYQIFSGSKLPSRDKLIMLCFGFSLSPEEAQQLLKLTGYPPLYVKVERDNAILFGLQKGLDIISMNSLLYELHLELLV